MGGGRLGLVGSMWWTSSKFFNGDGKRKIVGLGNENYKKSEGEKENPICRKNRLKISPPSAHQGRGFFLPECFKNYLKKVFPPAVKNFLKKYCLEKIFKKFLKKYISKIFFRKNNQKLFSKRILKNIIQKYISKIYFKNIFQKYSAQ